MIIRPAETYRRTAEAHGLTQELVTSVGEAVFGRLMDVMCDPKELAYELDHVGTFHVKHKYFLRKLKGARTLKKEEFIQKHEHLETMMKDFKERKTAYKKVKDDYRQENPQQSSQSKPEKYSEVSTRIL